jgi:hypothetical protein
MSAKIIEIRQDRRANSLYKHNLLYKHHLITVTTTLNQPNGKWIPAVSISSKMNYECQIESTTYVDEEFDTQFDAVQYGRNASKTWIDGRRQIAKWKLPKSRDMRAAEHG